MKPYPHAATILLTALFLCAGADASTHTWQGPAGGNWSVAGNWVEGVAPANGEAGGAIVVVFGLNTSSVQNVLGLVVDQIHFTGTGNTISGPASLGINGSTLAVNIQNDAGTNTLAANLPLVLSGASCESAVTNGTLTIAGNMSGSVGFVHAGPATVTITSTSNTYTGGTDVFGGTMVLNSNASNTAIPGSLTIGNGFGAANTSVVRLLQASEIADTSAVTINSDGLFDLNNSGEIIGSLNVNGGNVTIGSGSLTLSAAGTVTMTGGSISATTGQLSLGGNITATSLATGGASISCKVLLNATRTITVNPGPVQPDLTIDGVIQNGTAASGITKSGTGTLDMLSPTGNTYTGTTDIDKGVMEMSATAGVIVPAALIIGNGADPAGSATVREKVQSSDIASTSAVTINASGALDMANETDVVGALSGSGNVLMQTSSALTVNNDNSTSTFSGSIGGAGGTFIKGGTGMLTLTGNNPFMGTTMVHAGTLALNSPGINTAVQGSLMIGTGAGAANSSIVRLLQSAEIGNAVAVTVMKDGLFDLNGSSNGIGALSVNGNVTMAAGNLIAGPLTLSGGSISATTGLLSLTGDITATSSAAAGSMITSSVVLNGSRTITVNSGAVQPELTLNGLVSNGGMPSSVFKTGAGTMNWLGSASNTFSGLTTIDKGVVQLSNTVGFTIPGAIVVGNSVDPINSAILRELQSSDLAATSTMIINASGQFDLNGHSDTLAQFSGGGSVTLGSGNLIVGDGTSQTYSGVISGSGGIFKFGSGAQTLTGNNTYTGMTLVQAGTLFVNGSQPGSSVTVNSGATLGGTGTVGATTVTGSMLSPGVNGPGQLSTGNLTLDAASTLILDLAGSTQAGSDSLNVTGTVNLGGCALSLNVNPNFSGTGGTQLVLINNDGADAITNKFAGRAEGMMITAASQTTTLSYVGGTGNDVTLLFANIPPVINGPIQANPSAPVDGQLVTFSVAASDANQDMLSYAWTFGDGSNGTGASPTHAFSSPGTYPVSVVITDGHGGSVNGSTMVTVTAAPPPAFSSQPFASPSPAGVGQSITFTAAASSANPGALTYAWTFGDGANGAGASVTHAYAAAGMYNVTLLVTDGLGLTVNGATTVQVNAPLVGTGNDSDGDGFSDGFETAAGTDPNNPNDTPTGGPATAGLIQPLTITKASIKLNFSGGGKDAISFAGMLAIPAGFNPNNAKVLFDVSGVSKSLILTSKGSAKNGGDSLKISLKAKKGVVAAQSAKFTAMFSEGTFATTLATVGLTGTATVKNAPKTVTFTMIFNQTILQKNQSMSYTAKKGKTGMANGK